MKSSYPCLFPIHNINFDFLNLTKITHIYFRFLRDAFLIYSNKYKDPLFGKNFPGNLELHLPPLFDIKNPPYRGGYGRGIRGTPPHKGDIGGTVI